MLDAEAVLKVKKQIEFYFSDSNLYRDNFLLEQVKSDKDGFVDIALLCTFVRLQRLLGLPGSHGVTALPESTVHDVADALKDSSTLVVSEDKRRVRRIIPLTKTQAELTAAANECSIYASPFPYNATMDELLTFFESCVQVNAVRMRRHTRTNDFKGSVFVELASLDEVDRVLGLSLEFAGAPLVVERKSEYMKRAEANGELENGGMNSPRQHRSNGTQGQGEFGRGNRRDREFRGNAGVRDREGIDAPSWKRRREEDTVDAGARDGERAPKSAPAKVEFVPGCVVEFDFGHETVFQATVTFGLVKDSFGGKDAGVEYVDYADGAKVGQVRFASPQAAQAAMKAANDKNSRMIAGYDATLRVLQGEQEEAFYEKVVAARARSERERERGGSGGRKSGKYGRNDRRSEPRGHRDDRRRGGGGGRGRGGDNKRQRR